MPDVYARTALLPDGWADDVLLSMDDAGTITDVLRGASRRASTAGRLPGVVIPGLPNVHSHAFQRGMAGLAERRGAPGESFWSWRDRMYAFAARLGPDDVEAIAAQVYVEMLEAGYTAVAEFHYLHHGPDGATYDNPGEMGERLFAAATRAGIGITLLPTLYRAGGFGGRALAPEQRRFLSDAAGYARRLEAAARATAEDGERALGVALHSLRAVPPDDLAPTLAVADAVAPGCPVHIHVAEQEREVEECLEWSGTRPVDWLLDHAPVSARWCLVHATHASGAELGRVARSGAVVGLCPTTEANLGDGIFPLRTLLDAGGAFAIGSDSHASVSPVEELRWLEYGQRLARRERTVTAALPAGSTARTLLEHAWRGGAAAVGRSVGSLSPGRRADWIVLDPDHPVLAGRDRDDLLDAWIFAGNANPVREVWVGGRRVVADGRHPARDEVASRFRRTVERVRQTG
jgi:formimidoylglutamate deiminase